MTYKPTDAELDALRQADNGDLNFVTLRQFRIIARAALAKWGTPVVAGEPQPTNAQAGAVPLTPEQAQDLIELESWGPEAISLNAQLLRTIRRTETAHGIKGGQHA